MGGVLQSGAELDGAELRRLEAARGTQVIAELEEIVRRHRLEHGELLDQQALDLDAAAEEAVRLERVVGVEQRDDRVELVQDLLEPELVDLVDDDEEELVVVRRIGLRVLQAEQIVEPEIAAVAERRRLLVGR